MAAVAHNDDSDKEDSQPAPSGSNSFTPEQYSRLLNLINQQQTNDIPVLADDPHNSCLLAGKFCLISCSNTTWIIDSGATNHMTYDLNLFKSLYLVSNNMQNTITIPDRSKISIAHHGTIELNPEITLHNVLHVPNFHFNLISVNKLCKDISCTISFTNDMCYLQGPSLRRPLQLGRIKNGLYYCQTAPTNIKPQAQVPNTFSCLSALNKIDASKLWHLRLGHAPFSVIKLALPNLNISSCLNSSLCKIYPATRQSRLSFNHSSIKSVSPFELLHLDTWGPYKSATHSTCHLFLTIVDDFTRCTWIYLMKYKSDASSVFQSFYSYVFNQFNALIKTIRSDNAPDLCEGPMKIFLTSKGISHYKTCRDTPQQNGVVERKHKHLLETARALYFQSNLPIHFWEDCVLTAAYLINRMPLQTLNNISPYEKLFHTKPNLSHLRSFGCLCYVSTTTIHRHKFAPRANPCIFIGYPNLQKAYKVYDLVLKKTIVSRDVIFFEKQFPFHLQFDKQSTSSQFYPFFLPLSTTIFLLLVMTPFLVLLIQITIILHKTPQNQNLAFQLHLIPQHPLQHHRQLSPTLNNNIYL